jgi:hypothetical protein
MRKISLGLLVFFVGCGDQNSSVQNDIYSKEGMSVIEKINDYRANGVTCAGEPYKATYKLQTVDVAYQINHDNYPSGGYDYDAVFSLKSDESLDKFFDDRVTCEYLFGEFVQDISYDEPTLFLGGKVDLVQ